jgi:hypothetical protein
MLTLLKSRAQAARVVEAQAFAAYQASGHPASRAPHREWKALRDAWLEVSRLTLSAQSDVHAYKASSRLRRRAAHIGTDLAANVTHRTIIEHRVGSFLPPFDDSAYRTTGKG